MMKNLFETSVDEDMSLLVTEFVESNLDDCLADEETKLIFQFNIVIDEICSNLVSYSKATTVWVKLMVEDEQVTLEIVDDGEPYNLLEAKDPDESLLEEDTLGGYGIFMVKKMMDTVEYQFLDEKNVVTLVKKR